MTLAVTEAVSGVYYHYLDRDSGHREGEIPMLMGWPEKASLAFSLEASEKPMKNLCTDELWYVQKVKSESSDLCSPFYSASTSQAVDLSG